jgi:hypothetical protein
MKTEANKAYDSGFALTEGELRRIHDTLVQQITRTPAAGGFQTTFELKYRNGSIATPTTLDDVLSQENFGSTAILRLKMAVADQQTKPANRIAIEFTNLDEDKGGKAEPIRFGVLGDDRDWVFVTGSQLEERVGKVRMFSPAQFAKNRTWIFMVLVLLVLFGVLSLVQLRTRKHNAAKTSQLDALEHQREEGTLKDPIQAVIAVARISNAGDDGSDIMFLPLLIIIPTFGLPAFASIYSYFQPPFNFLWGDAVTSYNKRRNQGRFLLGGVLLVIVLGLIVNFISKKIGI